MPSTRLTFSILMPWLLCLSMPLAADESQPVTLQYRFEPGQIVRYEVGLSDTYRIQLGETVEEPFSRQTSRKNYRVISVREDGSAELELMIEAIVMQIGKAGMIEHEYRSDQKEVSNAAFTGVSQMVGKPYLRLTMSPTGEVSNIRPLLNPEQTTEDVSQAALDIMIRLPEQPLNVGATWREDFETSVSLGEGTLRKPIKMQRRFTLRSVENGLATVAMETKVLTAINEPDEELQMLRRQPTGTLVLDLNRGILVNRTLTQENEVTGFGGNAASLIRFKQQHVEKLTGPQTAAR